MIPPPAGRPSGAAMLPRTVSRTIALMCAMALAACGGEPEPERSPVAGPTATPSPSPVSPSPTSSLPFAPTADCEDVTVEDAVVTLTMEDNAFDPACLVMLGGQSFRLRNRGTNLHNFSVEGTQVNIDVPPGEAIATEPIGQVVESGTFTYFCKYHRQLGMDGDMTVTTVG